MAFLQFDWTSIFVQPASLAIIRALLIAIVSSTKAYPLFCPIIPLALTILPVQSLAMIPYPVLIIWFEIAASVFKVIIPYDGDSHAGYLCC